MAKLDGVPQHSRPHTVLGYSCLRERLLRHLEGRKEASRAVTPKITEVGGGETVVVVPMANLSPLSCGKSALLPVCQL